MVHNLSSLVLVFLLFVASSNAIPIEQVNAICNQTKSSSFCFALLNSKPDANLVNLTQYTIHITHTNVINSIKLINSLIAQSANDTEAKTHYTSCLGHFKDALDHIDYSQELLENGDYQGVRVAAGATLGDIDDCISGESPSDPTYPDHSMLPQYAAAIDLVAEITVIMSKSLFN
ncbi:Pectinesterase inhibitor 2 [Spatholobus suberectus]|nr:Pectinesterase inhibitor 2 [Spatholobus suberectus]